MKRMMIPFLAAATPDHRLDQAWWKQRIEQKLALAKQGGCDPVFL